MSARWTRSWLTCKPGVAKQPSLPVRLAPRFLAEMKHQIAWIAERNPLAAVAADARVRVALRRLSKFPELGRPGRVAGTRELSVPRTRFVIAYRVRKEEVEVAALLHSAQEWPTSF
jgi:toxin ParE1/3/4